MSVGIVPERILEEWNIGEKARTKLKNLEEYDFSKLTNNFIDKGVRFSPEQVWPIRDHFGKADIEIANLLEKEFKRFVALTVIRPGRVYAPSGPVDMYWHFFVLWLSL
jgi:hypothetical protein